MAPRYNTPDWYTLIHSHVHDKNMYHSIFFTSLIASSIFLVAFDEITREKWKFSFSLSSLSQPRLALLRLIYSSLSFFSTIYGERNFRCNHHQFSQILSTVPSSYARILRHIFSRSSSHQPFRLKRGVNHAYRISNRFSFELLFLLLLLLFNVFLGIRHWVHKDARWKMLSIPGDLWQWVRRWPSGNLQ